MSFDPVSILRDRFAAAAAKAFPGTDLPAPAITPSTNSKFGDFQCNSAMTWAKALGKNPRQVATDLLAHLSIDDVAQPLTAASIAGPGFINITLKAEALPALLTSLDAPTLGIDAPAGSKGTVVVDLCGVNLAKQMHIGHLRSTVIGDTLARVLQRSGWKVIRQNHVGDWGLPIAMVTSRLMDLQAADQVDLASITLDDLDAAYKAAKKACDADEHGLQTARRWHMGPKIIAELQAHVEDALAHERRAKDVLIKLQAHDPAVMRVWQRISDVTMDACLAICARLNADVRPEHSAGESSYAAELAPLVNDLEKRGIAENSDGALVVRLEEFGIAEPCIVRKSDGGYIYATTDLAAIRRRVGGQGFMADRVVYCVDARQGLHFKQVFAAARKAGYAGKATGLEHAAFGMILGEDGRPFKSRSGDNVKLLEVIDEAEAKAHAAVTDRNPELSPAERAPIARAVAVAAIRYTDLSTERIKDYVFSLDRMVKFEGDTGPYLLYARTRIASITRKAREAGIAPGAMFAVEAPQEKSLALQLLRYPEAVRAVADTLEPHRLCAYLYELAGVFNAFYQHCSVINAETPALASARLRLCSLTERVLTDGLTLLGIPLVDRM